MSKLRATTKQNIIDTLDRSHFTSANFQISFPDDGQNLVGIEYIPNKDFFFNVSDCPTGFITTEAPSQHFLSSEETVYSGIVECIQALHEWTVRIYEDFKLQNKTYDEFAEFEKSINEKLQEHIQDEEKHFDPKEVNDLKNKLDALTKMFEETLERIGDFEDKFSEVNRQMESLKDELNQLPRGIWYRKAASQVLKVMKTFLATKEGRELLVSTAKQVLLEVFKQ